MLHPIERPGFLLWHATLRWPRGLSHALAPRAIAVVEQVDAEFFEEIPPTDALQVLRRLTHVPEPDLTLPIEQPAGG